MSQDRHLRDQPKFLDNKARCKKEHFKTYIGHLREPLWTDELDAERVVELVFGGRYKFVPAADGWYLVIRLP